MRKRRVLSHLQLQHFASVQYSRKSAINTGSGDPRNVGVCGELSSFKWTLINPPPPPSNSRACCALFPCVFKTENITQSPCYQTVETWTSRGNLEFTRKPVVFVFENLEFTWKPGVYLETWSLFGNLEFIWKPGVYLKTGSLFRTWNFNINLKACVILKCLGLVKLPVGQTPGWSNSRLVKLLVGQCHEPILRYV